MSKDIRTCFLTVLTRLSINGHELETGDFLVEADWETLFHDGSDPSMTRQDAMTTSAEVRLFYPLCYPALVRDIVCGH